MRTADLFPKLYFQPGKDCSPRRRIRSQNALTKGGHCAARQRHHDVDRYAVLDGEFRLVIATITRFQNALDTVTKGRAV